VALPRLVAHDAQFTKEIAVRVIGKDLSYTDWVNPTPSWFARRLPTVAAERGGQAISSSIRL